MDVLLQRLDEKLRQWEKGTAEEVRRRITELIELADQNALDLLRSRSSRTQARRNLFRNDGRDQEGADFRISSLTSSSFDAGFLVDHNENTDTWTLE